MKKIFLTVTFAIIGLFANAQENVIKVNPLSILGGTDLLSYERAIGESSSVLGSVAYSGFKIGGVKYTSFGGGAQYRYYFSDVLDGFYGAGVVSFQSGKVETNTNEMLVSVGADGVDASVEDSKIGFTAFGGGLKIGHQWIWDSGFALDLNLGASYKSFGYDEDENKNNTVATLKASGVLPTFGFALGYGF